MKHESAKRTLSDWGAQSGEIFFYPDDGTNYIIVKVEGGMFTLTNTRTNRSFDYRGDAKFHAFSRLRRTYTIEEFL